MTIEQAKNRVLARIDDAMATRSSGGRKRPAEGERIYAFQHMSIVRFKVGKFEFRDSVLRVPESDVDEFLDLWETLQASDRNQIVALKEESNTRDLREFKAVRGAVGTKDIVDKTAATPASDSTEQPISDAAQASAGGGVTPKPITFGARTGS